ncbi:hypothetical protein CYMTET_35109 [Cymbomonas tetramitiformis]|uniref:Uncharacterized protein n=1 Tax=Cymbomonas tetramitiformis TaxID=36881 RepID=A0AAE0KP82_9CHLO|nr:hypothetical protein CYMTET_35109 [Cymbomonas tetramitiformis]|eukprot:gene22405-27033_t
MEPSAGPENLLHRREQVQCFVSAMRVNNGRGSVEEPNTNGLYARLLKFRADAGGEQWLSAESQPFPFVLGPESLHRCLDATTGDILHLIGATPEWVQQTLAAGFIFRLVIFHGECLAVPPRRASWNGIADFMEDINPVVGGRIRAHLEILRDTPFQDFQFDPMLPLDQRAPFCTVDGFLANGAANATALQVRCFMYYTLKCSRLYRGDGYAYSDDGVQGCDEYVISRCRAEDIPSSCAMDLPSPVIA